MPLCGGGHFTHVSIVCFIRLLWKVMSDFILFLPLLQIEDSPRQGAEFISKVARLMVKLKM